MKIPILALFVFLSASSAFAQTKKLSWDQPGVTTVAQAQALVYRLQVDGSPPIVTPQTCTLSGTTVSCTTPFAAPLSPGTHTITLIVDNGFDQAVATVTGPAAVMPVSLKIVITVSVP